METVDLLIHARWLITGEQASILENHALAVKNGCIHAILPSGEAKKTLKATHESHFPSHAILPGFINSHTHLAMNVFRGLADDLDLMDWLNNYIWPAESKWVSEELVFDASCLAMAEMIRCGTVCFNDMYFFLEATAKAATLAGLRGHIGLTIIDVPTAYAKTPEDYFAKAIDFYEQYKNHPFITPTLAPHSTYTVSIPQLMRVKELADAWKIKINIHLQEAPEEVAQFVAQHKKRPLEYLHQLGLVSPDLIAIHMTQINDRDLEILQETKANIVHCPESNMKLGAGSCPVQQLTSLGINVALGTDGAASNNDLDMLGEMRSAAFLGKITTKNPKAVPAETAFQMATINGAKALGKAQQMGSLKKGKSADFIAVDLSFLETQPLYHPLSQIVYAASRQQVTDVWVAGKPLLKNRELLTLDEKELLKKAEKWQTRLASSTDFKQPS